MGAFAWCRSQTFAPYTRTHRPRPGCCQDQAPVWLSDRLPSADRADDLRSRIFSQFWVRTRDRTDGTGFSDRRNAKPKFSRRRISSSGRSRPLSGQSLFLFEHRQIADWRRRSFFRQHRQRRFTWRRYRSAHKRDQEEVVSARRRYHGAARPRTTDKNRNRTQNQFVCLVIAAVSSSPSIQTLAAAVSRPYIFRLRRRRLLGNLM